MATQDEHCAFCQIANNQTDTEILLSVSVDSLYPWFRTLTSALPDLWVLSLFVQNEELLCFRDVKPGAAHHYLVITRTHIDNCKCLQRDDIQLGKGPTPRMTSRLSCLDNGEAFEWARKFQWLYQSFSLEKQPLYFWCYDIVLWWIQNNVLCSFDKQDSQIWNILLFLCPNLCDIVINTCMVLQGPLCNVYRGLLA